MSNLQNLKKRLKSVKLTEQIANAMKSISSAKFAKLSALQNYVASYAKVLNEMSSLCGGADNQTGNESEKTCYVVLGSNRGLCGSFNHELLRFAEKILRDDNEKILVVCGKNAIHYLSTHEFEIFKKVLVSDIPEYEKSHELAQTIKELYYQGEISSVKLIYMQYVNTLVQRPVIKQVLPFELENENNGSGQCEAFPDTESVSRVIFEKQIDYAFYSAFVEAATGAQASTLIAMRTAYDSSNELIIKLENEVNRKRQNQVTAGVIETSQDILHRGDE